MKTLTTTVAAVAFALDEDRPWSRPKSQRFSWPVRFSSTEAYCPVTPTSWRIMCWAKNGPVFGCRNTLAITRSRSAAVLCPAGATTDSSSVLLPVSWRLSTATMLRA